MEENLIEYNDRISRNLAKRLSVLQGIRITGEDVIHAIFVILEDKMDMEWIPDVFDLELPEEELFDLLKDFDFTIFNMKVAIDIGAIEGMEMMERKKQIKINNSIWRIHPNDVDPFPSKPHAHELTECLKCDLTNGACYKKKTFINYIPKKHLLRLREAAEKAGFDLPPLNLIS